MRKPKDLQLLEMPIGRRVSFGKKRSVGVGRFCLFKRPSLTWSGAAANDGAFWSGGQRDFT